MKRPTIHKNCENNQHPDHSAVIPALKKAEGQIRGIQKMIEDGRYCVDILIQFKALQSALKSAEAKVFEAHLHSCVQEALESKSQKQTQAKINELVQLILKR